MNGTIRSGRNAEPRRPRSPPASARALATTAGVDPDSVSTATRDIEASYTMEGGVLLPEPGSAEEAAWVTS